MEHQIPTDVPQQIEIQRKRAKLFYDGRSNKLSKIEIGDNVMASKFEWMAAGSSREST